MCQIPPSILYSYLFCGRQAWFHFHHVAPEEDHVLLEDGKFVQDNFYKRKKKNIALADFAVADLVDDGKVVEIKRSSKAIDQSIWQLKYYLYILKQEYGILVKGEVRVPEERMIVDVELDEWSEKEIERMIAQLKDLLMSDYPPPKAWKRWCETCGFKTICWG